MTKADLIDEVSKLSNLTKKETETIVNTIFDNITDALAKGDKVELRGFGSFRIRHRNTRKGPARALRRLWAPWRMAWIGGARPAAGCVFCSARDGSDDRASFVLLRGAHAFLILNAYPYAPGHLMAVTNRHVAAVGEAQPEELTDAMTLVQRGVAALTLEYRAEGFNVGLNQGRAAGAGIEDH